MDKDGNLDQEEQYERAKREDMAEWNNYRLAGDVIQSQTERWIDPVGAWSDLPDTILEDFDNMRHATSPTPPIEEL